MLLNESKSEKDITPKIKLRIMYAALLTILGIVSLYVGIFIPITASNTDFSSGFYTGTGSSIIAAGMITIIRNIRLLKNHDALKRREIYEFDERNRMIGLKSWSYAGYAIFLLLYIALLFSGILNIIVMKTILAILAAFAVCLFISRCVLKKIM